MTFKRLSECFIAYGTVKKKRKEHRRKTATNDENAINILAAVQLNSMINTRQIEREYELSRRSILRILHEIYIKFHPYHLHQNLEEPDFVSRMNFCNIRMINKNPTFLLRSYFPIKLISV